MFIKYNNLIRIFKIISLFTVSETEFLKTVRSQTQFGNENDGGEFGNENDGREFGDENDGREFGDENDGREFYNKKKKLLSEPQIS